LPDIQHSALSGSDLHEPKGIASASVNQIYAADGAGSGNWYKIYTQGFEDYNHAGSSIALTSGVSAQLLNDGAGTFTNKAYQLPGFNDIWNTTTNQLDFSGAGLSIGDTVDIRIDTTVTTAGANNDIELSLDLGIGASPYSLVAVYREWRTAGTYQYTTFYSIYMGDANTLNNPCEIHALSNSTGNSIQVNGWYIRVIPRNPVIAA